MHKTVTKILIAICLLIGGASAQKIAYIDADAITTNFRKFQEAQKEARRLKRQKKAPPSRDDLDVVPQSESPQLQHDPG